MAMSCWLTIPSKRPPEEAEPILNLWRERGYKIALYVEDAERVKTTHDYMIFNAAGKYPGYAAAVNKLALALMEDVPDAEWFIAAGDDIEPDLNHTAEEIVADCRDYFGQLAEQKGHDYVARDFETFGVMQPTGDRWGDKQGAYIDRVAGSAWIGREFARRINSGNGPLWPEYFHMGCDEELQAVAIKYGVFWQRRDLIHLHRHWGRARAGEVMGQRDRMPAFLERANSDVEWAKYKKLYAERQAAGFPGSEML